MKKINKKAKRFAEIKKKYNRWAKKPITRGTEVKWCGFVLAIYAIIGALYFGVSKVKDLLKKAAKRKQNRVYE